MKKYFRIFGLALAIIIASYFLFRLFIFQYIIEEKLQDVYDKFQNISFNRYVVADNHHEGSEFLPTDFTNEERKCIEAVFNLLDMYVGPENRIYMIIERENRDLSDISRNPLSIKISTHKKWRDSILYFGDILIFFSKNKDVINKEMNEIEGYQQISDNLLILK